MMDPCISTRGTAHAKLYVLSPSGSGATTEHIGFNSRIGALFIGIPLPLPDGRVVVNARSFGRERLVVMGLGKDAVAFAETDEETAAPMALVGTEQVAFLIGSGANQTIALASAANGRIVRKLAGPKGAAFTSIGSSPDGETIYYSASGSVWSIPATDGMPRKLRAGDMMAVDRYREELIVGLTEKRGVRLVRQPLAGGPERPIPVQGDVQITDYPLNSAPSARMGGSWCRPY